MSKTKIYFIANGEAAADEQLRELVGRLRHRGYEVEVRASWEDGQTEMFAREALRVGAEAVVACGGDGTLHEVANALMEAERRPTMAGLPFGTGNDFLRGLEIDPGTDPLEFEKWLSVKPRRLDVGKMNGRYFLNVATAGVGATITAETSSQFKNFAGSAAYFVSALPAAFDLPVERARIEGPGFEWEGELTFLFVGNGSHSGGGWTICPAADLQDGLLDVVVVPKMGLTEMASAGREMVKAARPGDYGPLLYRQLEELRVTFDEEVPLNLDGEPFPGERFEFSVVPQALSFISPNK